MDFDLRTSEGAYNFILDFMSWSSEKFEYVWNFECGKDFEQFWKNNYDRILSVNISDLRVLAYHIIGALDDCKEIRTNGLVNLQKAISGKTLLNKLLDQKGIKIDINSANIIVNEEIYNINYDFHFNKDHFITDRERVLSIISNRLYHDYCINGFMYCDDVFNYGSEIHKRPEILMRLAELFPEAKELEDYWKKNSKSYRIDFYAKLNQIHPITFALDELKDPPYADWDKLDDEMKTKKWILSHAINRVINGVKSDMIILFIKNDVTIPPDQILGITEL